MTTDLVRPLTRRPLPALRALRAASAAFLCTAALLAPALACEQPVSVCDREAPGSLGLVRQGQPVAVVVEAGADPALQHAGRNFVADLARVAGRPSRLLREPAGAELVLIGVLGQSPLIDGLVARGRIDARGLRGRWEAYRQVVLERPFPGVARALVIAGSDRRGAVFGTYDLSAKMGVSPWVWWADVPVQQRPELHLTAGSHQDQPVVKYRGIFINDENPAFDTWARTKFGGINAQMYGHVFELLLRLKANYLWPAMWTPKAFNADDPRNMVLADEMGIVMGTSHHEPMMRAHDEWSRFKGGAWDYTKNGEQLRQFWRGGIERMVGKPGRQPYESLVTLGMRGDGDEPMSEETATGLLERIVADQRRILAEVTGRPAAQTPQVWALYKEVQDYYDQGMRVPDDVLLLFADDNWGNVRRLPDPAQRARAGGFGVYYHFDYVGGPRNYKWLNTNQIEKTWQQMNLAHERGAHALWVVNVGDIKPVEFPTHFFLDMAWNPQRMDLAALNAYSTQWAQAQFGATVGGEVGEILKHSTRLAALRKPELVDERSFALGREVSAEALDGGEFGRLVEEWRLLERRVLALRPRLRAEQLDAYYQLVEHQVLALSNYYQLYYSVAWNRRLAAAGDARANAFADRAEAAFRRDQQLVARYHALQGGKWQGMMLQTKFGYTSWQSPERDVLPALQRVPVVPGAPALDHAALEQQLQRGAERAALAAPPVDVIAIEAPHYSRAYGGRGLSWAVVPNLGRSLGAVTALPQGQAPTTVADGVRLEYDLRTTQRGDLRVHLYMVPTLDTNKAGGVRVAVALGDRPPQVLTLDLLPTGGAENKPQERNWARAVRDSNFTLSARFDDVPAGPQVLKVWRLDDNAVLQKLVVDPGQAPASALGPQPALR